MGTRTCPASYSICDALLLLFESARAAQYCCCSFLLLLSPSVCYTGYSAMFTFTHDMTSHRMALTSCDFLILELYPAFGISLARVSSGLFSGTTISLVLLHKVHLVRPKQDINIAYYVFDLPSAKKCAQALTGLHSLALGARQTIIRFTCI